MSLTSRINDLATRIGSEFNDVRDELSAKAPLSHSHVGLSNPYSNGFALMGASVAGLHSLGGAGTQDAQVAGASNSHTAQGAMSWANMMLGHRLTLFKNTGVGGKTSNQIITEQLPVILAMDPKPRYVLLTDWWQNNLFQDTRNTLVDIIADSNTIINAIRDAGMTVILSNSLTHSTFSTAENQIVGYMNDWIAKQAQQPNTIYVDLTSPIIDISTGGIRAALSTDGVHPNSRGAQEMGLALASALKPYVGGGPDLLSYRLDPRHAGGDVNMIGTSGTKASGITGSVANYWAASWFPGMVGTGVAYKIPRDDGLGELQALSLTSPGGILLSTSAAVGTGQPLTVGSKVRIEAEIYGLDDWVNVSGLSIFATFTGATGLQCGDMIPPSETGVTLKNVDAGVWQSPEITIPSGVTNVVMNIFFGGSAGSIAIGRACIRRMAL